MRVSISMDNFPMLLLSLMIQDLSKCLDHISVEVGGEDTVFVSFYAKDANKTNEIVSICEKYRFGG